MAYQSPGVYVEEVPSAIKAIAGASTSTPVFIGVVPASVDLVARDQTNPSAVKYFEFTVTTPVNTPKLVTSFSEFAGLFGGLVAGPNDTTPSAASPAPAIDPGQQTLARAVFGFFNNGGSSCYVMRVAQATDVALPATLAALEPIDDISLVAMPGETSDANRAAIIAHCSTVGNRFAIFDGPETVSDITTLPHTPSGTPAGVAPSRTDMAAWYFPWIKVFDPATKLLQPSGNGVINTPPSGHLAGLYARVDNQRGVHKAPANEVILGALGVSQAISKSQQDKLNPKGVNCIRAMNGNVTVWGARTVGGDDNADLKYINVRRTLLFLRQSIEDGTQWVVFEPNSPALWQKIVRNITGFLLTVWRAGALFGTTQQEAFYVKCDAETNPPELRELGQVVTEIGVSIVRPAEFVIFRISQFVASGK
ncbi:MAG TPA: phage tail sheath subtilisin-like domain-containing protein [Polyangiaceae bacterium]